MLVLVEEVELTEEGLNQRRRDKDHVYNFGFELT
jgi:hypothetical protein